MRASGSALVGLVALVACPPALAHVYWANATGNSIGRANLDGSGVNQAFIAGATAPNSVTVGGQRLYWSQGGEASGSIGRASLDGSGANQALLTTGASPRGVAVDSAGLYWGHTVAGAGKIGRAALDGSGVREGFISTAADPCGVAVDPDKVYWSNPGSPGSIGRAHGAFDVQQAFIPGASDPCGVAVTHTHLYWVNRAGDGIGRANLDGTGAVQAFIPVPAPCGLAVNGTHVYWSSGGEALGRANLDGTGAVQRLITGARGACGMAVDPTVVLSPARYTFRASRRAQSAIRAFVLTNTSSSALAVSAVRVTGVHRRDFVMTGNGCTLTNTPAGGSCLFNLRFRPRGGGRRRATIRVLSNASNSPTDVPLAGVVTPGARG